MMYVAKKKYVAYSPHVENLILWKCEKGDKIDVERLDKWNLYKITNRTIYEDALFSDWMVSVGKYKQLLNDYFTG